MELILAIVVASAVILFGAIISMGNERQRKAIDNLHNQIVLWAKQDLSIKREKFEHNIRIDDPLNWLNKVATKVYGQNLGIQVTEVLDNPKVLVCYSELINGTIVFTLQTSNRIRHLNIKKGNRLLNYSHRNPIIALPRNAISYEISVFNGGIFFDLELSFAWKALTGEDIEEAEKLWMYVI